MAPTGRVLHLGPLHSVHLARWAELTRELGLRAAVAGHLRAGIPQVVRADAVEDVRRAPALGSASALEPVRWSRWLRGVLRDLRPDVVHAHWLPGWGAAAAMAGCRPLVVSAWGSDAYRSTGLDRRLAGLALRRADRVLAPSPHLVRELEARGVPATRIGRVDLGVDLEAFRPPDRAEVASARAELGLGAGPVILSFRAAQPLYNLPVVIEAFQLLRRAHPAAELLIAHGARPPHPAVAGALARSPGVCVAGNVPHERMPLYLRAADVGVSIPSSDGSPRSVWECLATGTPVVLSDLPQLRERLDGNRAVAFARPTATAVAAALADLVAREPTEAGRAWAGANVDSGEQARRLESLYRDFLCVEGQARRGRRERRLRPAAEQPKDA